MSVRHSLTNTNQYSSRAFDEWCRPPRGASMATTRVIIYSTTTPRDTGLTASATLLDWLNTCMLIKPWPP